MTRQFRQVKVDCSSKIYDMGVYVGTESKGALLVKVRTNMPLAGQYYVNENSGIYIFPHDSPACTIYYSANGNKRQRLVEPIVVRRHTEPPLSVAGSKACDLSTN